MANKTISSGKVTFVDLSDKRNLQVHISSNLPTVQIYDSNNNNYTPDWSKTNLILEARVYLDANDITNKATFTWSGVGGTVNGSKYTIKSNVLSVATSIQTYSCEVSYDGLTARDEITFSQTRAAKDGTSVRILGSYDTVAELQAAHPNGNTIGDSYLVKGVLYVWNVEKNAWVSSGNITGPAGYTPIKGIDYRDGVDGQDGKDGVSIVWKGDLSTPPSSPKLNWVYRNTTDHTVQIYNGTSWELMVLDGTDGTDGTPGSNGLSVFITYNDNTTTPSTPTGNGTTNGWHTNATTSAIWMSQKVAESATSGVWGTPIKIKGEPGITHYTWIKYADTPTSGMSDSPDGKTYMGIAYNKTTATESTNYSDYTWALIKGANGVNGTNGRTYYTWVRYADDVNGTNMSDSPDGKYYIGLAYNKSTATESNTASDYQWSLFRGSDGVNGSPASIVRIVPSALYFKSTTGQNGIFTPEYIYLYPRFQTVAYSNWQYSVNGGETWISAAGANGLSIGIYNSVANSLRISRNSSLYTDLVTSVSFRCNSNNNTIYDIVSIAKIYDVVGLQIGGRNLFKGFGEEEVRLLDYQGVGGFTQFSQRLTFDPSETVGETYTISFYAKSPNGVTALRLYNQNNNPRYLYFSTVLDEALGNEWKYYTYTFTNTDRGESFDATNSNRIEIYAPSQLGVLVKKIKVEKGNTATDWSPAPEDIIAATKIYDDYVIEQGESGAWTYRKWSTGVAECWGTLNGTLSPYTTINGFSAYEGSVSFPTNLFTSSPNVQFQPYIGNGFAIPARGGISTATQCKWVAFSNVSTANTTVKVDVFAIGKWK